MDGDQNERQQRIVAGELEEGVAQAAARTVRSFADSPVARTPHSASRPQAGSGEVQAVARPRVARPRVARHLRRDDGGPDILGLFGGGHRGGCRRSGRRGGRGPSRGRQEQGGDADGEEAGEEEVAHGGVIPGYGQEGNGPSPFL